jgi:hypothetical protein
MALSNTFSFTVARDDVIRIAMMNVGALGEGEIMTAQETLDCGLKLNMMVKQWQGTQDFAPGLKMWTRQRGALFLSIKKNKYVLGGSNSDAWAGGVSTSTGTHQTSVTNALTAGGTNILSFDPSQNIQSKVTVNDTLVMTLSTGDSFICLAGPVTATTVTMAALVPATANVTAGTTVWNYTVTAQRPLQLDFRTSIASLRDVNNNDTPLNFMTLQEYETLPNKSMPTFLSDPTAVYYESQIGSGLYAPVITGGGVLYLDCFPQDVTKHLHIVYLRSVMDLNSPSDNPEYPQQWYRALCWGLSKEIASMFDAEWTHDMEENYQVSLSMAREQDSETSALYFQPGRDESI